MRDGSRGAKADMPEGAPPQRTLGRSGVWGLCLQGALAQGGQPALRVLSSPSSVSRRQESGLTISADHGIVCDSGGVGTYRGAASVRGSACTRTSGHYKRAPF